MRGTLPPFLKKEIHNKYMFYHDKDSSLFISLGGIERYLSKNKIKCFLPPPKLNAPPQKEENYSPQAT